MYRSHGDTGWGTVGILLIILVIIFLISKGCSATRYNNGICTNCGGHYVYQEAVGHRYETYYLYRCDKCGNLIEINTFYNDGRVADETGN